MNTLFESVQVGNTIVKNRICVPPMVCFSFSDHTGYVTQKNIAHYKALADGGPGLIVIEATCVTPEGRLSLDQLGLWEDGQIEGMKALADAIHLAGAKAIVQIHHAGDKRNRVMQELKPFHVNDLSVEAIKEIEDQFVAAVKRAVAAGFDGVELHGAHGYLLCQMANSQVNTRQDAYGGDLDNRLSLAKSIIEGVKATCPDMPILAYRMGANEPDLSAGIEIAKKLQSYGVNLLHVSAGLGEDQSHLVPEDFEGTWIAYMGTAVKAAVEIPVILVNGVRTPEEAAYFTDNQLADFVALGRAHLVDPAWANKAQAGQTPVTCLNCKPCRWFKDGSQCPQVVSRA